MITWRLCRAAIPQPGSIDAQHPTEPALARLDIAHSSSRRLERTPTSEHQVQLGRPSEQRGKQQSHRLWPPPPSPPQPLVIMGATLRLCDRRRIVISARQGPGPFHRSNPPGSRTLLTLVPWFAALGSVNHEIACPGTTGHVGCCFWRPSAEPCVLILVMMPIFVNKCQAPAGRRFTANAAVATLYISTGAFSGTCPLIFSPFISRAYLKQDSKRQCLGGFCAVRNRFPTLHQLWCSH
jgi:hypothetical protein